MREIGRVSEDGAVIFNVVEILRETDDFDLEQELEITKKCDPDTLYELYHDLTRETLEDIGIWDWRLPGEVERFADRIEVESARVDDLEFWGGDAVNLRGYLTLTVCGHSFDPEELSSGTTKFSYNIEGYWTADGIEIESIK